LPLSDFPVSPRSDLYAVGVMFYEAQIAGLPDFSRAVRLVKAPKLAPALVKPTMG